MSHSQLYEFQDMDYSDQGIRRVSREKAASSTRRAPTHSRKRGKSPVSVNGIHRRRNRKISW